jgi:hypothetical protein
MTEMELWRDIPGLPGYQASDHWSVRSLDRVTCNGRNIRGRVLAQFRPARHRRLYVCVCLDGQKFTLPVDDLVLAAWGAQQVRSFPREGAA